MLVHFTTHDYDCDCEPRRPFETLRFLTGRSRDQRGRKRRAKPDTPQFFRRKCPPKKLRREFLESDQIGFSAEGPTSEFSRSENSVFMSAVSSDLLIARARLRIYGVA